MQLPTSDIVTESLDPVPLIIASEVYKFEKRHFVFVDEVIDDLQLVKAEHPIILVSTLTDVCLESLVAHVNIV